MKDRGIIAGGSFRDPSGFVFRKDDTIYRQVNMVYKEQYDHLIASGLYEALISDELLLSHDEIGVEHARSAAAYKIIKPEFIPYISYPYEWCFSQLKNGALASLRIAKRVLDFGMCLKDCSAYNIQLRKGKPILIDTLSFEKYVEGQPPLRSYLRFSLLSHIHFHAKSQRRFADKSVDTSGKTMSRLSFLGLIDNLESAVRKMKWEREDSEWSNYYEDTNYSSIAFEHKKEIVSKWLERINPKSLWDMGANTGEFSRIAGEKGINTIAFDGDPVAVEANYKECLRNDETNITPLLLDLTNPSAGIGWANEERASLIERGPADTVLMLALIHHLTISNNVPFPKISEFCGNICKSLIIEFVPKSDSQVQRLLSSRQDVFTDYSKENFEKEFQKVFTITSSIPIVDSDRTAYLMTKRTD